MSKLRLDRCRRTQHEIRVLLMEGAFSKQQIQILIAVLLESWGRVDQPPTYIEINHTATRKPMRPKDFVIKTKMNFSDVSRTLTAMVNAKILRRYWGYYAINNRFDQWDFEVLNSKKRRRPAEVLSGFIFVIFAAASLAHCSLDWLGAFIDALVPGGGG